MTHPLLALLPIAVLILIQIICMVAFYSLGKTQGERKIKHMVLDFFNDEVEKDVERSERLLEEQAEFQSKKKPTKEEKEHYDGLQAVFYSLWGRTRLFDSFNKQIVDKF